MKTCRDIVRHLFSFAWIAMALCPVASLAQASAGDDLRRLLPADTVLAVYIRDVPALLAQWRTSPLGRFYNDSRSGSFFSPLRKRIGDLRGLLVDDGGLDPERLDSFFSGRWLLAGLPAPPDSSDPVAWVLIFDHNNDPLILDRFRMADARSGATVHRQSRSVSGLDYERLRVSQSAPAEIPGVSGLDKSTASQGRPSDIQQHNVQITDQYFSDRLAILAIETGEPIRRVLPRLAQTDEGISLADRPDWLRLAADLPSGGDLDVFADTAALAEWCARHPAPEFAFLNLSALRLTEIRAAGATLDFRPNRFEAEVSILAPDPRRGVSRLLFPGEGRVPNSAPFPAIGLVPGDALAYAAGHYPLGEIWTVGRDLLRRAMPLIGVALDLQVNALEQSTGLDLRRDLLDWVGPEAARFSRASGKAGRTRIHSTYLLRLRRPAFVRANLANALHTLSRTYGAFYIEEDRVGDWPLITLYVGNPESAGSVDRRPSAFLCLADSWLVAGDHPADIGAVLRRMKGHQAPSLAAQADFKAVMERLPDGRVSEAYLNLTALRALVESMNQSRYLPLLKADSRKLDTRWLPVDLRALPSAAFLSEAFGPVGYARRPGKDQLHISAFILYPDKAKGDGR